MKAGHVCSHRDRYTDTHTYMHKHTHTHIQSIHESRTRVQPMASFRFHQAGGQITNFRRKLAQTCAAFMVFLAFFVDNSAAQTVSMYVCMCEWSTTVSFVCVYVCMHTCVDQNGEHACIYVMYCCEFHCTKCEHVCMYLCSIMLILRNPPQNQ
jgi:hypothetical protein